MTRPGTAFPSRALLASVLFGALAVPGFGLPELAQSAGRSAVLPAPTFGALSLILPLLPLLPLLSIGGLLALLAGMRPRAAAFTGGAWGMGFFLTGVSWVYVSMAQFSGLSVPVAALATLLFCAYLALFPALACALWAWLIGPSRDAARGVSAILVFAAAWTLGEWLRGTLFTGFPWLALGYAQVPPSPLAGWASVLGVYGMSFISVLCVGLLLTLAIGKSGAVRNATPLLLGLLVGIGAVLCSMPWTIAVGVPVEVNLLQGNVPLAVKWEPGQLQRSLDAYLGLLNKPVEGQSGGGAINVLPETALPLLYEQIPPAIISSLVRHGPTLLGVAIGNRDGGYANAAVALTAGASRSAQAPPPLPAGVYAKRHLVPFGEFSPPGFGWFFRLLRIPMSDFSAGPAQQPAIELGGLKIAPDICYEDLFGEELLPALRDANVLVNLSNTAWFGDSLAQPQHLQIARVRAMETGRVMLRATNSGMTAMILPNGDVAAKLPPFTPGVLHVEAQRYIGLTPYAKWGNALILVIIAGVLLNALRQRRKAQ